MNEDRGYLNERDLDGDCELYSLDQLEEEVLETARSGSGVAGQTIVKQEGLSALIVAVRSGETLEEHSVDGPATIQTLQGAVEFRLPEEAVQLSEGDYLVLGAKRRHDVKANEDSILLITFHGSHGLT